MADRIAEPGEGPPPEALRLYVLYRNPSDYPGMYVVRQQWAVGDKIIAAHEPWVVTSNLVVARAAIPPGLVRMYRHPTDDPVIVEIWV